MRANIHQLHCLILFCIWCFFFSLFFFLSFKIQLKELSNSLLFGLSAGFGIFFLIFIVLQYFPRIISGKKAEQIDKNLVFCLKDLLLHVTSGTSLYNAFVNVSKSGYGDVAKEFGKVSKKVNSGTPMSKALERLAFKSKSQYLKRASWQLINTIKAGASVELAIESIIKDLILEQREKIKAYGHELNLWGLIYLLFAVAIPTIGSTMLIILSSFGGLGLTQTTFVMFMVFCFIIQTILIGFIKSRRPLVTM